MMGIMATVVFLLHIGCGGRAAHEKDQSMLSDDESKRAFSVEFGEQGGFTGGYVGYAIDASGSVTKIGRLPGREPSEESLGAVSGEDMASLRSMIHSIGFFRIAYTKPGNMTYSILVRRDTEEHRVSWAPGDENVPKDLTKLRSMLLGMIKKVTGEMP